MSVSRRAFIVMTSALPFMRVPQERRVVVFDQALSGRLPWRIDGPHVPLIGDTGWLWHEYLCGEKRILGITRPADAFVLTRLASDIGMRTAQRALDADTVLWSLQHRPGSFR